MHIIRRRRFTSRQRHGHHAELLRRAALQKQNVEILRQRQQLPDIALQFRHHIGKPFRAMTDAKDG